MSVNKKPNYKYNSLIPEVGGDIKHGQDLILEHWFNQDRIGKVLMDVGGQSPIIMSGGIVTKGTGDTLNITACIGYHKYQIEIPDSFASVPPTKTTADIDAIRVESVQQTNMAIASAVLNGSTVNYVKLKYIETNGNTRPRAKKVGTYSYELIPSYQIVVDTVAPTAYELCLTSFTGTSGGAFIFSIVSRTFELDQRFKNVLYPVGSFYVQYPDVASNDDATAFPVSQRPQSMYGGTWAEQFNTMASFFRTAGTIANENRTNGLQGDQFRSHTHPATSGNDGPTAYMTDTNYLSIGSAYSTGALYSPPYGYSGGNETRPINYLIKVWKRTVL